MKLNSKFFTHETYGEHYMVSTGDTEFKGIVKNNDTAAFIIECLKENTTINDIVDKILAEYDVDDKKTVEKDVEVIIDKLRNIGAIEE